MWLGWKIPQLGLVLLSPFLAHPVFQVFDQFALLDTTIFPETFGPRDEDPLIRFGEWLNDPSQNKHHVHDYFETLKQSLEANRRMKDRLRQEVVNRHKEARAKGPAERMILSAVGKGFIFVLLSNH